MENLGTRKRSGVPGKWPARAQRPTAPSCRSEAAAAEAVLAPSAVWPPGSPPHPSPGRRLWALDSALIRKVGVPPGSPGARRARSLARASGAGRVGGGAGVWRGAPPPIAGPCCGLLTWRAENCCNHGQRPEVRAKCKGLLQKEALPQAPPRSAGEGGKKETGPRRAPA